MMHDIRAMGVLDWKERTGRRPKRRETKKLFVARPRRFYVGRGSHERFNRYTVNYTSPISSKLIDQWFRNLDEDAEEEALDQKVVCEAKRIVSELSTHLPSDTDVYIMEDTRVAVEVFGRAGGFLLVCELDKGALCIINTATSSRRARYSNSGILPDRFVIDGLGEIDPSIPKYTMMPDEHITQML